MLGRAARDLVAYAAVKGGAALVSVLPQRVVFLLASGAGSAIFHLARRRRRIALRNLEIAFRGRLSLAARRRIARRSFQHALANAAGLALAERWVLAAPLDRVFAISPAEERLFLEPSPRGLAILTAHVGDWEMGHR